MFVIVIRGRNCAPYLRKCLNSLVNQTCQDWRAHLILDEPTDNSIQVAHTVIAEKNIGDKMMVTPRPKRCGLSYNMWHGIHEASPMSEDIVGILDADDRLYPDALKIVAEKYANNNVLLTYGSYKKLSKGRRTRISHAYKSGLKVRRVGWRASHFKTFKYKLFELLPKEEMQYKGMWLPAASDVALMIPLIEMAGLKRCKHIHKLIYLWRDKTPHKTNRKMQIRCENIIRAKKPLRMVKI